VVRVAKLLLVSLVHNRKHLLGECVLSAVNQTLPKDQYVHLLWDNNSTDGAVNVAEMLVAKYSHLRLFKSTENLGQQRAFNRILNDWIPANCPEADVWVNCDSDDTITPNALAEVRKAFDSAPGIGAAYSGFNIIDGHSRIKMRNHPKAKLIPNQNTSEGQRTLRRVFIGHNPCGHIRSFRISCLRELGGFDERYTYATDYSIFGRVLSKYPVIKVDQVLYNFRQHGDQVEGKQSPQQTKDWLSLQAEFREQWTKDGLI
jgi:GT2 family glycosyltransferase